MAPREQFLDKVPQLKGLHRLDYVQVWNLFQLLRDILEEVLRMPLLWRLVLLLFVLPTSSIFFLFLVKCSMTSVLVGTATGMKKGSFFSDHWLMVNNKLNTYAKRFLLRAFSGSFLIRMSYQYTETSSVCDPPTQVTGLLQQSDHRSWCSRHQHSSHSLRPPASDRRAFWECTADCSDLRHFLLGVRFR